MTINVQQPRMDKATFLDWAEAREEHCELVGGRVVMVIRPVVGHALIIANLRDALRDRLSREAWYVLSDCGIDTGPQTIRAPDVVVMSTGGDLKAKTASSPVLIAEVLSPSTATIDLGDKVAEYLRLPSLLAYLVVAQDEPKLWLFLRGTEGFGAPQVIAGLDASVAIPALGLDLPLAEILAGVHAGEAPQAS
ncbi:MAG: Uma2 family endonuclease [Rhodoplanes sp.]|uniref:Uma2 family endonuclease n=1 Tax=Rhodoplanes sp. TaxID=1968906 RepID=UPI0017C8D1F1|nr:Uma2 family endonuclease [Rhodoplanes sp.]NVO17855.1 Uma2 family endonuclease [Rhodoplanes sp.]